MNILQNVPLVDHSTMRLGGSARYLCEAHDRDDVAVAIAWAQQRQLPLIMIGEGSNIVWSDKGFQGLVIVDKIMGFGLRAENSEVSYVEIGAGEVWDTVVKRTVDAGLTGIEALSLIPGTAGATPIQNVGAYGQEIADSLVSVEAYDTDHQQFITITAEDCGFAYRTSRFKTTDRGRFFITSLRLQLSVGNPSPPYYPSVEAYLQQHQITELTPALLREAVIAIRNSKLPDPKKVANNGSFFGNPIISTEQFRQLIAAHPKVHHWELNNNQQKISAAWLVEQAGFKAFQDKETGMATWPAQPLVLVNEHAQNTNDLLRFKQKIVDKVQQQFAITLVQEPELIGEPAEV